MTRRPPVLVLDADQPSALAVVRSLGRLGVEVTVGASGAAPLAGRSRFASAAVTYPDPLRDGPAFVAWVQARQLARPDELVVPITERTVVPLHRQRASLDLARVAIAPAEALEQALDKDRTVRLATGLGIPVPRSIAVQRADELQAAAASLGFPLVVKPSRSVGQHGGQRVQLSVSYARTAAELADCAGAALRYGEVILQEFFRGEGVGIEVIAAHGTLCHVFQHRRLHEVPLTGGGSSLRISEPVLPALHDAAAALLGAIGWHGVAMVEFKHDPATGAFRLIEINGRFWGSLPLAVAAGADFPAMLHELMTTGRVTERPAATAGIVCRLLSRDMMWIEHVLRQHAPPGLMPIPPRRQVVGDTLRMLAPRHRFDVQSWSDPWPGLVDLGGILRQYGQRVFGAAAQRVALLTALRRGRQALRALPRRHPQGGRVLFVCYGNINRSAVAHQHSLNRHGERWTVASAGFHDESGRPADPRMVAAARQHGVDLSGWRSHRLSADDVAQADLILAMELSHLERLQQEFPASAGKSYLLATPIAQRRDEAEVADPYGREPVAYDRACRRVIASVDAWLQPQQG